MPWMRIVEVEILRKEGQIEDVTYESARSA
jgi:hypothetical protein